MRGSGAAEKNRVRGAATGWASATLDPCRLLAVALIFVACTSRRPPQDCPKELTEFRRLAKKLAKAETRSCARPSITPIVRISDSQFSAIPNPGRLGRAPVVSIERSSIDLDGHKEWRTSEPLEPLQR